MFIDCSQLHQIIRAKILLTKTDNGDKLTVTLAYDILSNVAFLYADVILLLIRKGSEKNTYVTQTIQTACNCIAGIISLEAMEAMLVDIASKKQMLHIRLEADNDFYSQVERVCNHGVAYSSMLF